MTFARPGFAVGTLRGIIEKAENTLGIVHENPFQAIQGGISGERYHLTLAELEFLQELSAGSASAFTKIYEPVMDDGNLLLTLSGDCLMAFGGNYAS